MIDSILVLNLLSSIALGLGIFGVTGCIIGFHRSMRLPGGGIIVALLIIKPPSLALIGAIVGHLLGIALVQMWKSIKHD